MFINGVWRCLTCDFFEIPVGCFYWFSYPRSNQQSLTSIFFCRGLAAAASSSLRSLLGPLHVPSSRRAASCEICEAKVAWMLALAGGASASDILFPENAIRDEHQESNALLIHPTPFSAKCSSLNSTSTILIFRRRAETIISYFHEGARGLIKEEGSENILKLAFPFPNMLARA